MPLLPTPLSDPALAAAFAQALRQYVPLPQVVPGSAPGRVPLPPRPPGAPMPAGRPQFTPLPRLINDNPPQSEWPEVLRDENWFKRERDPFFPGHKRPMRPPAPGRQRPVKPPATPRRQVGY